MSGDILLWFVIFIIVSLEWRYRVKKATFKRGTLEMLVGGLIFLTAYFAQNKWGTYGLLGVALILVTSILYQEYMWRKQVSKLEPFAKQKID